MPPASSPSSAREGKDPIDAYDMSANVFSNSKNLEEKKVPINRFKVSLRSEFASSRYNRQGFEV
jgi:hypothetical protein